MKKFNLSVLLLLLMAVFVGCGTSKNPYMEMIPERTLEVEQGDESISPPILTIKKSEFEKMSSEELDGYLQDLVAEAEKLQKKEGRSNAVSDFQTVKFHFMKAPEDVNLTIEGFNREWGQAPEGTQLPITLQLDQFSSEVDREWIAVNPIGSAVAEHEPVDFVWKMSATLDGEEYIFIGNMLLTSMM